LSNNNNIGIDGLQRKKEDDEIISKNILATFSTPSGKQTLGYLRSLTLDSVAGPNISDGELRHLEGQRYIIGLITRRMNHGEKVRTNV
tara:strand:- start:85 stop:348 length:264 start_codon:yes stop_codon:yes gene_type:complete